tara:strand:+ start:178 stop:1620 length:1443 start_codon:yes stop_codon:yes gene_type:complete
LNEFFNKNIIDKLEKIEVSKIREIRMSHNNKLNRRAFLRSAGMTAIAGVTASNGNIAFGEETNPGKLVNGKYNFDEIYNRDGTGNIKWDSQYAKFGAENIDVGMGIADMDFRTAPAIKEALEKRIKHENWGYEFLEVSYKEAIAEWNIDRHGINVDPDTMVISSGVHPGLIAALNALCKPKTKVLLNTPTYNGFYGDLRWSHTEVNDNQMIKDKDGVYHIDWDDFESRLTPDTHAFLLCNPQNPTGNLWSEEDLLRMGELCLKHGVIVLSDEIHCDFVLKGQKYTPFASLPDKDIVDNSLTFKAISKTFSISGMKSAYFFSTNPVLLSRVEYMHRADKTSLGIIANEAGYRDGRNWLDQLLPYIDGNQTYAELYIKNNMPMVKYKKAQGTYLAWLDVSELAEAIDADRHAKDEGLESAEHYVEKWLVENSRVQINPGYDYGPGGNRGRYSGKGHMRMNLATSRPLIKKALSNMANAIKRI